MFTTYRTECLQAALAVVNDEDWLLTGAHPYQLRYTPKGVPDLSSTWVWLACNRCDADKVRGIAATCLEPAWETIVYPRTWWTRYVARVRDVLDKRPTAGVVVQPPVVDPLLDEAALCRTCAPKARRHLTEFSHMLLERIEQATNQVGVPMHRSIVISMTSYGRTCRWS